MVATRRSKPTTCIHGDRMHLQVYSNCDGVLSYSQHELLIIIERIGDETSNTFPVSMCSDTTAPFDEPPCLRRRNIHDFFYDQNKDHSSAFLLRFISTGVMRHVCISAIMMASIQHRNEGAGQ